MIFSRPFRLPVKSQTTLSTRSLLSDNMQKTVWLYLKSVARKVVLRFWLSKRKATLRDGFKNRLVISSKFAPQEFYGP